LKTDDWGVQICIVGAIAVIVVSVVGVYVYDLSEDKTIAVTQNKDVKPQSKDIKPQSTTMIELEKEIREEADKSEGALKYYEYAELYDLNDDGSYHRMLNTISNADSCSELFYLFETHWAWHARSLVAEKILELCF